MGGIMTAPPSADAKPVFVVRAAKDDANLRQVDFIVRAYDPLKKVATDRVHEFPAATDAGEATLCKSFTLENYDPAMPIFVYARIFRSAHTAVVCLRLQAGRKLQ